MTLEQFREIKRKLASIIKQNVDLYEQHKNDENYNYDEDKKRLEEQYLEIQNRLLSYDLSDIPFAEWMNMKIISDENHIADFSKTKANIDFDVVEYYGNGNFKGCNVRNLDKIQSFLNLNEFDEQTIQMNSQLFLSDAFGNEFKEKYYNNLLKISDLASLSSEQLEEIKQKGFREHLDYNASNILMLETLGLDKVVLLYNHSEQEYEAVSQILSSYSLEFRENTNSDVFSPKLL